MTLSSATPAGRAHPLSRAISHILGLVIPDGLAGKKTSCLDNNK